MKGSEYIHKSHNVSVLLYYFVCLAKYRKVTFSKEVDETLLKVCLEIEKRYELHFLEIGTDKDHIHFLMQSVSIKSPTGIVKMLKSITARELFRLHPEIKKQLWGGSLWSSGYFVNTVSKFGDERTISKYVRDQGIEKDYKMLHKSNQLKLF
ncbi:IS200/IS605 family transposase [Aquimarina aggregata]|uniref:IS200/IS605 family transposase n=1 Tax=Aquimarina aggregata TaxID=1642818 RepID=UPI00248F73AE|nr:IS200/IS605 family transposase [Aquimarina aggregata]